MKSIFILGASLGLLLNSAIAQETTNNPSSKQQATEDRVQFLMEVSGSYFAEDDFKSACDALERVLEIDPDHKEARYTISHFYIQAKQYQKAEKLLIALLEESPKDFQLMNNLSWLYATAEDPTFRSGEKAIKLAQEALVLSPKDHHIWSTLSEAYYVHGEYEKAHRAITHMASLAVSGSQGISKKSVEDYNEQIRKCKRAWDAQKMLSGEEDE